MKRVLLCFATLGFLVLAHGQKLPGRAMGMPENFDRPYLGIEDEISDVEYSRPWKVYSDRNENPTYTEPGGTTVKNTVGFMQRFYVAERKGDFLHIYDDPIRPNFPGISNEAVSYGWIHKDHLLLWEHSLVDPQNHIDRKAMILSTFDGITPDVIEEQLVEYRFNPGMQVPTGRKSRLFEILFVYKILDNAVLLGQDVGIYGTEQDVLGMMRGWVPTGSVTFWDHRFTLEPNWEAESYRERQRKGVKPSIFSDARAAADFQQGRKVSEEFIIWTDDPGDKRNIGEWRRFPILPGRLTNLYKAGVMGKVSGAGEMSVERYSEIREASSELELNTRKINVVFVVDGTASIGKFYDPISRGIVNSVNMLKSDDTQNRFRFGSVIYRDKAEGEHLAEVMSLQDDPNEIVKFLGRTRTDYNRDRDLPEAVYFGLRKALTSVGLSTEETNLIVLIGDAGNHDRDDDTRLSQEEIIELAAEYECSFICFQANNGMHETFDDFIAQSQGLILGTARRVHTRNAEKKELWRPNEYTEPYFTSEGPNRYSLKNQEIAGSFLFPDKGSTLPYSVLQEEITRVIASFDERTSIIIQEGKQVIAGQELDVSEDRGEVSAFTEAVIGYLSKIRGLTEREIAMIRLRNYQFSMDGYTARDVRGMSFPLFREVLFLSGNELTEVTANLNKLTSGFGSINQKRQQMQEVWLELLSGQVGDIDEEEILSMTVNDISEFTLGLPVQSQFIRDVKLKDITEPSVVSDLQFENYLDYFRDKVTVLRSFLTEGYEQSFYSNGMRYYWVPIEDFP